MRTIILASFLSLSSLSCSFIVRGLVTDCQPGPPSCNGDILVTCSADQLEIRTDCSASLKVCNAELSACSTCGNGVPGEAGEDCDDGNAINGDSCENDCTLPFCGNSIVDLGEDCDNAGANSDIVPDACRSDCSFAKCGDEVIDTGEACDDGDNNADAANACRLDCVLPTCGDGIVDFEDIDNDGEFDVGEGEACDDNNNIEDDGCNSLPDTEAPIDPFNSFPCNKTFPGCNNDNAREVNSNGDHELCYDRAQTQLSLGNNAGAQSLVARDFDGNAPKNDIIVVKGNQDKIAVFLNDGSLAGNLLFDADFFVNPAAIQPPGIGVGIDPIAIATADFDGDTRADVVTANQGSANISLLLNRTTTPGASSFTNPVVFAAGVGPASIATGDINGDGLQDVVTANPSANAVNILIGNGAGSFADSIQQTVGTNKKPVSVVIADVDDDGDNDIITANQTGNDLTILVNSNLTFTLRPIGVGSEPLAVVAADMEGDNDLDLITANSSDDTVSILLQNLQGNFDETTENTQQKPTALFVGDLNHDDQGQTPLLEIIVVNEVSNTITILRAKESAPGTFAPPLVLPVGQKPVAIASTDFDFNTYFDIAVVNNGSDSASIIYFTP
jgi:cysteine-rich repeat protein